MRFYGCRISSSIIKNDTENIKTTTKDRAKSLVKYDKVPEIVFDFEYKDGLLFIILENIGYAPAYRLSVKFDRKVIGHLDRQIDAMNVFTTLAYMPPGKKFQIFVDSFKSYLAKEQPLIINISLRYSDKFHCSHSESITHNLSIYKDLPEILRQGNISLQMKTQELTNCGCFHLM